MYGTLEEMLSRARWLSEEARLGELKIVTEGWHDWLTTDDPEDFKHHSEIIRDNADFASDDKDRLEMLKVIVEAANMVPLFIALVQKAMDSGETAWSNPEIKAMLEPLIGNKDESDGS